MARTKKETQTDFTEDGQKSTTHSEIGKIISNTSAWIRPACKDEDEIIKRIGEYQNLCAAKEEAPYIENMCLYLGISKEQIQDFRKGEGCTNELKQEIDKAFTWILSIDNQLVDKGKKNVVSRIWNGKQYHNEREPNNRLEDLLAVNLLKDLPSSQNIARKYLEDYSDSEDDEE